MDLNQESSHTILSGGQTGQLAKIPLPFFWRLQPATTAIRSPGLIAAFIILSVFLGTGHANEKGCRTSRMLLTTQFSVLEDPDRSLTLMEVNGPDYTSRFCPNSGGQNNFGMSRSAFWFRIEPRIPPECMAGWFLALSWPLIDSIDFYWHENHRWQRLTSGARYPYGSRQIVFHNFVFRIPDLSYAHPPYYLRIAGDNPLFMEMRLLQQERFMRHAYRRMLLQGIFLGVLLGLLREDPCTGPVRTVLWADGSCGSL